MVPIFSPLREEDKQVIKQWRHSVRRDLPGGPVVRNLPSSAEVVGPIPDWGTRMPHASQPKTKNIEQKQYYNKFNKDFKNSPHLKKKILKIKKYSQREKKNNTVWDNNEEVWCHMLTLN